jgi:copper chaperone CopZ
MMKGLSPGAALVFLMAGPATNTATMAVIGKAIDRKTLAIYMVTIIGSAMLFGYLTNLLLPREWFAHLPGMHGEHQHEILPRWLQVSSAIVLAGLILHGYIRKLIENKNLKKPSEMAEATKQIKVRVEGMTCNHCKMNVEKSILKLEGIEGAVADPDTSEVVISGSDVSLERIRAAVEDIGYAFKGEAG